MRNPRNAPVMRILFGFMLVACSSPPHATTKPTTAAAPASPVPFERWLERWKEARACLITPADDFDTGVALAVRSGRDCKPLLRALDTEPIVEDTLVQMWRFILILIGRVESAPSLQERTSRLQDLDHTVDEFELLVREGPPEPLEGE